MPVRHFARIFAIPAAQGAGHGQPPLPDRADNEGISPRNPRVGQGQSSEPVSSMYVHPCLEEDDTGRKIVKHAGQVSVQHFDIAIVVHAIG